MKDHDQRNAEREARKPKKMTVRRFIMWVLILMALVAILSFTAEYAYAWSGSTTLEPGETKVISYTNDTAENEPLGVTNISAPAELLPYLFIDPALIENGQTADVTIQFITVPVSVLEGIAPDTYAVKVGSGLIVYLDMGESNSENAFALIDNLTAELENLRVTYDLIRDNHAAALVDLATVPPPDENMIFKDNLDSYNITIRGVIDTKYQSSISQIRASEQRMTNMIIQAQVGVILIVLCLLFRREIYRYWKKSKDKGIPKKGKKGKKKSTLGIADL